MNNPLESINIEQQKKEMLLIAEKVLEMANTGGATSSSLSLGHSQGVSVEVRHKKIETLEFNKDSGLSITLYIGKRKGSASTSDCSDEGLTAVVKAALAIAKYTTEDPFSGLAEAKLYPDSFPDLDLYHPWQTSIEKLKEMANQAEDSGFKVDKRITNSDGASISTHESISLKATSLGLRAFSQGTRHGINTVLIAEDEKGKERDYYYTTSRNPDNLLSPKDVGRQAAERVLARLDPGVASQGYYPVIFSPEVARGLLSHYLGAISGGALYRKTTFLLDSLGTQVFPDWFQIHEKPHLLQGFASTVFDGDGVATGAKLLVENGVNTSYLLSCYSARKLALQTTGNCGGAFNLSVKSNQSKKDIYSSISEGLLVTELMGDGVNQVTGDYSRGASGFWIKNGVISHPVRGITIAGNLSDMFKGIQAVGDDIDNRSSILTGSILIDKMTVACE